MERIPRIDFKRRKLDHTNFALDFAFSLKTTPLLVEIYYPAAMPWADTPPSYYIIQRDVATPISRERAEGILPKVTILPDRKAIYLWK